MAKLHPGDSSLVTGDGRGFGSRQGDFSRVTTSGFFHLPRGLHDSQHTSPVTAKKDSWVCPGKEQVAVATILIEIPFMKSSFESYWHKTVADSGFNGVIR